MFYRQDSLPPYGWSDIPLGCISCSRNQDGIGYVNLLGDHIERTASGETRKIDTFLCLECFESVAPIFGGLSAIQTAELRAELAAAKAEAEELRQRDRKAEERLKAIPKLLAAGVTEA